ncbi:MAG: glycosyltransferase [Sphingomonadales bacterium]|nr:glycosyltransferase [Sphingomonadales bacterium]
MSAPAISVLVPAYDGAALIGETIASVLAQSDPDFEVIVVDDCSRDDTLARLRAIGDRRLRVIAAERNGGPVAARNRAFAEARGRYIAGLDQDDLCHPQRFAAQRAFLDAHPEVVLVASQVDYREGSTVLPPREPHRSAPALIDWQLHFGNPLVWSSVMFRAAPARALGTFEREERLYAEDFDFYHRLGALGAIARIDQPLLTYRIHEGGASKHSAARMIASATAVLAERYQPVFGIEADDAARLVVGHFASGNPVPDAAVLARLAGTVARVHEHFLATRPPDAAALALIMGEYSRRWWQVATASVRAGRVPLPLALGARPSGVALSDAGVVRAATSAVLGHCRAMKRRAG